MFVLQGDLEGEKQFSRAMGLVIKDVDDFSQPLQRSATGLLHTFDANFKARGAIFEPGGWVPRKVMKPWPLLEDTGEMRGSFVSAVTSRTAVIGNTDPKFKYHQSNKPRKRIPRRVMMMIDKQRKTEIVKHFQEYVVSALQRRF